MTELRTTVTAVAVYPDRARVTRGGMATLEPGSHRLEVPELPLTLDPASVRVAARGTARARLLGVDVRRDFYVDTPAGRVRELEGQVEALQDEMGGLDAQAALLKREQAILGELAGQTETYARGLAYGKIGAAAQMALLDDLRSRAEGLNAALLDLAVHRRDLDRRLQKLRSELDQLRGSRGRERYTAVVEVEVAQAGDGSTEPAGALSVELTYVVSRAGWRPLYDVRLLETDERQALEVGYLAQVTQAGDGSTGPAGALSVELTYVVSGAGWQPLYDVRLLETDERQALQVGYLAQVTQRTGEDWPDVALTLSTARPSLHRPPRPGRDVARTRPLVRRAGLRPGAPGGPTNDGDGRAGRPSGDGGDARRRGAGGQDACGRCRGGGSDCDGGDFRCGRDLPGARYGHRPC